jgi:hypothetical protein
MTNQKITDNYIFSTVKHHWLTVAFLLGFVTDFILLNRVDDKIDNLILFFYVVLATTSMVLFYVGVAEKASPKIVKFLSKTMPILMQYSFGGLLSGMLIFYGRSGDLLVSAPFLALIILVILANELVKKRSDRLLYNLIVYFIGVFSYLVLVVPVMLGEMGNLIFIISGLLALLVMVLLIKLLSKIIPNFMVLEKRMIVFSIGSLYTLFNLLYFFNIIPPIPLSLTELSIYQGVERTATGGYRITKTEDSWLQKFSLIPTTFRPVSGGGAYCFARVYAPTSLKTEIVHHWEYKDSNGAWQNHFKFSYQVSGENKNGYRGFTKIDNIRNGVWRCTVETTRGQVLGRRTFTIDTSTPPVGLVTVLE